MLHHYIVINLGSLWQPTLRFNATGSLESFENPWHTDIQIKEACSSCAPNSSAKSL